MIEIYVHVDTEVRRSANKLKLWSHILLQSPFVHHPTPLPQFEHAGPFVYGFCPRQFPLHYNTHSSVDFT